MVDRAGRAGLADLVARQGQACGRLGSPLYAGLMARAAADVRGGGPVARVLRGHEADRSASALPLRLLAGVHRLVLAGRAPQLAVYFPSAGGVADPNRAWPAFLAVLEQHEDELRAQLDTPPQTNEVGRGAALVGALLHLAQRLPLPVHLHELGASAGLNLRADRFRITGAGVAWGPPDSPVVLEDAWTGPPAPVGAPLRVVERAGCDAAPLDPASEEDRLRLASYVWADQSDRMARLCGALRLAEQVPARVVAQPAADYLDGLALTPGSLTVVWHSVMWQYVDPAQRAAVTARLHELGAAATERAPLAHVALEPGRRAPGADVEFLLTVQVWPGAPAPTLLGHSAGHGLPMAWEITAL